MALLIKLLFKYDEYLFRRVFERNTVEELLCGGRFDRCLLKRRMMLWSTSSWLDMLVTFHAFYRFTDNILIIITSAMDALFLLNLKLILLLVNRFKCHF